MPKAKWESVIFTAYKFFDSKELLFFVVPEDIHTEGFAAAQHSLQGNAALPPAGRAAAAILTACRWLSETRALFSQGKAAAMWLFQGISVRPF